MYLPAYSDTYIYLQVPLWVALNLRQRQKCRIVQPEWMAPDRLEAARDAERESPFFAELGRNSIEKLKCHLTLWCKDEF